MDRDPATIEQLRGQLEAMRAKQRARGGVADPSFWDQAAHAPSALPEPAGCLAGEAGSTSAKEPRRARARMLAPEAREPHPVADPFRAVPPEQLDVRDLSTLAWADEEAMAEPGWIESVARESEARFDATAAGEGRAVEPPTAVMVEAGMGMPLRRHDPEELTRAVQHVAQQRATHEVMLVNLVSEMHVRGLDSPGGLSQVDWLRTHDPSMGTSAAKAITVLGAALTLTRWARLRMLVTTGQVPVTNAAQLVEFHDRVAPVADPADLADAVTDLTTQARVLRPEEFARLVRHHTEQVRPPRDSGDDDTLDEGRRQARGLWFGQPNRTGMVTMRGVLDPEAAAVIKAGIDPLSAPCPTLDEHGRTVAPDLRSPARRRADGLVEIVRRGVAAGDGTPVADKAKVVVLIDLDTLITDLTDQPTRTMTGDVLSAGTARRMACDAGIIPMVLGTHSEPLDVGREKRLVGKGLRLALHHRDQGCTFPGCTIPPQWTDAHHATHWAHGGATSLTNTALLCQRHHTYVHTHHLTATVTSTTVTWHT